MKKKVIHFILVDGSYCYAACDGRGSVFPIEDKIDAYETLKYARRIGTFNPKKVTCKRCLKNRYYEQAMDKIKHPLFSWKQDTIKIY